MRELHYFPTAETYQRAYHLLTGKAQVRVVGADFEAKNYGRRYNTGEIGISGNSASYVCTFSPDSRMTFYRFPGRLPLKKTRAELRGDTIKQAKLDITLEELIRFLESKGMMFQQRNSGKL